MKAAATITMDEWLAALDALDRAADAEGETTETLAVRFGCSPRHASLKARRLVAAGKAEVVGYRKRGSARFKVYRLIEGRGNGHKLPHETPPDQRRRPRRA